MKRVMLILVVGCLLISCSGPSACDCAKMTRPGYVGSSDFDLEMTKWSNCQKKFGPEWEQESVKKCDE